MDSWESLKRNLRAGNGDDRTEYMKGLLNPAPTPSAKPESRLTGTGAATPSPLGEVPETVNDALIELTVAYRVCRANLPVARISGEGAERVVYEILGESAMGSWRGPRGGGRVE